MTPPVFLVVPADAHYKPGEAIAVADGYELHVAKVSERDTAIQIVKRPVADFLALLEGPRASVEVETVILELTACARVDRPDPAERRRRARQGHPRRVGAAAVPMEQRWEVHVFRSPGTPDEVVLRLVAGRETLVSVAWRRVRLSQVAGRMRKQIDRKERRTNAARSSR